MVKYVMARSCYQLFVPALALGLLLVPHRAKAQLIVTGPSTPAAQALVSWWDLHIPSRYRAHGRFEVNPLTDAQMDAYLQSSSDDPSQDQSSHSDDGEIDGVFEDNPPRITLRVPNSEPPDMFTFAHEYGHYVWFNLLSKDDRKRYEAIYKKQKNAHHLVTHYAATDVEEGFAEAFSFYANEAPILQRRDPASYQFLNQ